VLRPCPASPDGQRGGVIASVAFRNFKALRSTGLRLTPFNLVVGPNGSGKSSLIQAVLRLRTLAKLPLADRPEESPAKADAPEISFTFSPPFEGVEAKLSCVSELLCDLLQVKSPQPEAWAQVKAGLVRMRSFVFEHGTMVAPATRGITLELAGNGANLAAILAARQERAPEAFARLEQETLRIFPEFSGFVFTSLPESAVEFGLRLADGSGVVKAENLSQGTLYLLAVLVIAHDPNPPPVVCIEEIDRGVHPRMLRETRDALYRLSYPESFGETRPPVQVIATTHSPYMLDLFREHPEEIVITQKQGSAAHFERLTERAHIKELLREGSLGDMWFSGILGGVPEEQ
jgi:predicted ATPase